MFSVPNSIALSTTLLFLELILMLLGILVAIVYVIDISLSSSTNGFSNVNYRLGYSDEVTSTLDFFFVLGPTVLVLFLVVPSLGLIFQLDAQPTMQSFNNTVWICGHQWYWSYAQSLHFTDPFIFSDLHVEFSYDSILDPSELFYRYQKVDRPLVVPVGSTSCFITSEDVIHSWALPSHVIKCDAVPGRVQSFVLSGLTNGVFFGQCSEICGVHHARMPIEVHFVPEMVWFIHCMDASVSANLVSSPLHHFVNITVTYDFFYLLLNGFFPFVTIALAKFYLAFSQFYLADAMEVIFHNSLSFLLVYYDSLILDRIITFDDFISDLLNFESKRLANPDRLTVFAENDLDWLLSFMELTLHVRRFFYFSSFPFNSVSLIFLSFCFIMFLLGSHFSRAFKRDHNFNKVLFFVILQILAFVYKVVSDYLARLNHYPIAYVHHFLPYFAWLFVLIFYMNVVGLLPFSFTVFSAGYVTLTLSAFTWLGHFLLGFHYKSIDFLMVYFNPELPGMVSGVVGMLEIISIFVRPISLGLRLTANMIGGHLIVEMLLDVYLMLTFMVLYCPSFGSVAAFVLFLVPVAVIYFYEFCVTFIQAYVFVLLLLIYLRESLDLSGGH